MEQLSQTQNDVSDCARNDEPSCASPPALDHFLSLRQVMAVTGMSKSSIYKGNRDGTFPAPVRPAGVRVAWLSSEIIAWQRKCIEARRLRIAANAASAQNNNKKGPPAKELDGPKLSVTTPVNVRASSSDVQRLRVLSKGSNGNESTNQTR